MQREHSLIASEAYVDSDTLARKAALLSDQYSPFQILPSNQLLEISPMATNIAAAYSNAHPKIMHQIKIKINIIKYIEAKITDSNVQMVN